MSRVDAVAEAIRASRGVAHKRDIAGVMARLGLGAHCETAVGDDAAAIRDGDGWLLLAIEGFVEDFVAADPWFAGYCGVMVNVSDIAAMGGAPIAIVDAVWSDGDALAAPLLAGLREAAVRYGVPIVGGHSNLRARSGQLAAAILGRAERLITSFDAQPGDALLVATDLRGAFRDPFPWWDASTQAPPARLREDLSLLPGLARDGLVRAGKDISMAGVIGTAMMLAEASGCGAAIDLARLPMPPGVALEHWLAAFPSFGFVLAAASRDVDAVAARFTARGIACARVGVFTHERALTISDGGQSACVWDFSEPFIGVAQSREAAHA